MKNRISGLFVPHGLRLLESPAWRVLGREAHLLLDRIEIEHMRHGCKENGNLIVTYADLEEYIGCHRRGITRAQHDTEALGLLLIKRGRGGNGEFRAPNTFTLSYLPVEGRDPSNEWAEIKTIEEARARLTAVRRQRQQSTWLQTKATKIIPFPS
jgi:hypothetical protein